MKKAVRDLQRGDKVHGRDGEILTVEANGKGLWPGSRLLTWRERTMSGKDWSNVNADVIVDLAP